MGAVAYDVIGKTDKVFDNSGPGLNCKVTGQQEFFGGCAGNIAYGLGLQNVPYLLLSAAGSEDFRRYAQHLNHQLNGILTVKGATGRANIITDPNGNQFTLFTGPEIDIDIWNVHLHNQAFESFDLFICAPFPAPMMQAALHNAKTKNERIRIWVPGQYADGMDANELKTAIEYCDVLIGNAHEIAHIRATLPDGLGHKTVIETNGHDRSEPC